MGEPHASAECAAPPTVPTSTNNDLLRLQCASPAGLGSRIAKRSFDIIFAVTALLTMSVVLLVIAMVIKIESRGPVLYRCRRVGFRNREFDMLKFRKMRQDAAGPGLTVSNDPRFTRVGRQLAHSKLDELPQLWNVLKGDMSVVGPRPESAEFVAMFPETFRTILNRVRPGLTGPSQLAFVREGEILAVHDRIPYYVDRLLPQKMALDSHYAFNRTLRSDLVIIWWTIVATVVRSPIAVNRATHHLGVRRRPPDTSPSGL